MLEGLLLDVPKSDYLNMLDVKKKNIDMDEYRNSIKINILELISLPSPNEEHKEYFLALLHTQPLPETRALPLNATSL